MCEWSAVIVFRCLRSLCWLEEVWLLLGPGVYFLFVLVVHCCVFVGLVNCLEVFREDCGVFTVVCCLVACGWVYESKVFLFFLLCVEGVVECLPELFAVSGVHPGYFPLYSGVLFLY